MEIHGPFDLLGFREEGKEKQIIIETLGSEEESPDQRGNSGSSIKQMDLLSAIMKSENGLEKQGISLATKLTPRSVANVLFTGKRIA